MTTLNTFLYISSVLLLASAGPYDRDVVVRVFPANDDHLKLLSELHQTANTGVDLWGDLTIRLDPVSIHVTRDVINSVLTKLDNEEMEFEVIVEDLQGLIDHHQRRNELAKSLAGPYYDFSYYMGDVELYRWIENKVSSCDICQMINFGKSFEGRDLIGIKVSSGGAKSRGFWIDGGIHAREWISPATVLYFIEQLTSGDREDPVVQQMLNTWDFYFFPLINVDGYNYTFQEERLWRKTRNTNVDPLGVCIGTDCNRNFDFQWRTIGASSDPCSNTFAGPEPFSEPEAKAISDYIRGTTSNVTLDAFVTTHSYGQWWLLPYGYTTDPAPNEEELLEVGAAAATALEAVYGTQYVVGPASIVLYPSSGTSRDWARGVSDIRFVYTIELRDDGFYGFELPPEQILPTGRETWAAIKQMGRDILAKIDP